MRDGLIFLVGLLTTVSTAPGTDLPKVAQQSFVVRIVPKIEVASAQTSGRDELLIKSNVRLLLQLGAEDSTTAKKPQNAKPWWSAETMAMTTTTVVLSEVADAGSGMLTLTIVPLD